VELAVEPPVPNAFALRLVAGPEDVDEQGHVSNVRVLDWMNRAAIAHSTAVGLDLARYRALGGTFVVRRHELDYLAQAFAGDEVVAFTWAVSCRRATAERKHEVRRLADGRVLARGFNLWAWVDLATGRPARMPAEVEAAFDPAKHA
jgi:acyl-CoA thioester hydrolase